MNSVQVETEVDGGEVICSISVKGIRNPAVKNYGAEWCNIWELRIPVGDLHTQEELRRVLNGLSESADLLVATVAMAPSEKLDEYIAERRRRKAPLLFGELVLL